MLVSRSVDESQLYMRLAPCRACAARAFAWSEHSLERRDGMLVSHYAGACDVCGNASGFEFELRQEASPAGGFGGATPSRIIDPGQFFALARAAAGSVPADPAHCDLNRRDEAIAAITFAIAAIDEVMKFAVDGEDSVPPHAFVADEGRMTYDADPAVFQLSRLRTLAASYRRVRQAYLHSSD